MPRPPSQPAAAPTTRLDEARRESRRKSLLHPLQRLATDFRDRMRRGLQARGHRLRPAHASVLVHLPLSGARLTALAGRAGVSKQAMGQLVDELESIGYLERRPDPEDGRAKRVAFSRQGLVLLADSGAIVDEIWDHYADLLGERDLVRLRNALHTLLGRLDAEPEAPGAPPAPEARRRR